MGRWAAEENWLISPPVSAVMICAMALDTPGIVASSVTESVEGSTAVSIRSLSRSMAAVSESNRSRCSRAKKACRARKFPSRASVSRSILLRKRPFAGSASWRGSCWPSMSAARIARPETPVICVAPEDNLMPR